MVQINNSTTFHNVVRGYKISNFAKNATIIMTTCVQPLVLKSIFYKDILMNAIWKSRKILQNLEPSIQYKSNNFCIKNHVTFKVVVPINSNKILFWEISINRQKSSHSYKVNGKQFQARKTLQISKQHFFFLRGPGMLWNFILRDFVLFWTKNGP